jgi:copper chaperone
MDHIEKNGFCFIPAREVVGDWNSFASGSLDVILNIQWIALEDRDHCQRKEMEMTTIKIKGMSCQHCVMAVTKALGSIESLKDVHVDLQKGEATFTEVKPVDLTQIKEKIQKAGFEVVD